MKILYRLEDIIECVLISSLLMIVNQKVSGWDLFASMHY